jgi:ribosome maturation factor RimP
MPGLQSSSPLHGIDRDALVRVVEPIVRAHGAELVDLELKPDQNGWVLRVFVEKAGASANNMSTKDAAVNLELCADVSHDLSPALDVVDLIPHAYSLEVSSPGVERPLRGEQDFVRFAGQKAKLRMRNPVAGQRVLVGVLDGVSGGAVRVRDGSRVHEAPLDSIDTARLVFEFGSDGKNKKKHRG